MGMVAWNESLSVGVKQLDDQHKKLVEYLNGLHKAMSEGKGHQQLGEILNALIDYTAVHFRTEEEYFKKYNFPGANEHVVQHQDLVAQVLDFQKKFQNGEISLTLDILEFLQNWITDHIQKSDKKYAEYLKEKSVA